MNMEQMYPLNINSLTYQPVIIQVFLNNEMFNFRMLKNYHEKKKLTSLMKNVRISPGYFK